jgi:murein L,D-transpeptidase YcbB/YkuD
MLINVDELVPQHIEKIYQTILKGAYINENSSKNGNSEMYNAIVSKENELRAYFRPLGYTLLRREGYYYFARDDASDGESALEQIVNYIEIANFLKTLDSNFSVGYRFMLTSMEHQLNRNLELEELASKMKDIRAGDNREFIQKIVDKLRKDGFVEETNTKSSEFIVLNSYEYIETFLGEVEIYE